MWFYLVSVNQRSCFLEFLVIGVCPIISKHKNIESTKRMSSFKIYKYV